MIDQVVPTLSRQSYQRNYGNTTLHDQSTAHFGDRYETSNVYSTRVIYATREERSASGLTALAANLGVGFAGGVGAGVGFGAYNSWHKDTNKEPSCPRPTNSPEETSHEMHEQLPLDPQHDVSNSPSISPTQATAGVRVLSDVHGSGSRLNDAVFPDAESSHPRARIDNPAEEIPDSFIPPPKVGRQRKKLPRQRTVSPRREPHRAITN